MLEKVRDSSREGVRERCGKVARKPLKLLRDGTRRCVSYTTYSGRGPKAPRRSQVSDLIGV